MSCEIIPFSKSVCHAKINSSQKDDENDEKPLTIQQFKVYYRQQIEWLRVKLSNTIQGIISSNNSDVITINIVERKTSIKYVNQKIRKGDYVDYVESVTLNIGYEEVLLMYENCKENIFDAFNKLVTHEFLHVLLGDFSKRKLNSCYNYLNGSLKKNPQNDQYYQKNPDAAYDAKGYEKIDTTAYNVAADFVINNELDIEKPFLRAKDYNLPEGLNVFQYYYLTMTDPALVQLVSMLKMSKFTAFFSNDDIKGEENNMGDSPVSGSDIVEVDDEDKLEDFYFGNGRSAIGSGSIKIVIKQLKKRKSKYFEYVRKMINQIKDDLFNTQNQPVSKVESWSKYNNRRDQSEILIPGKAVKKSEKSNDVEPRTMPVIFIDCSGSMMEILKELFYFCYSILQNINCTMVFYDTSIKQVIKSANSLNFQPNMFGGGGTSLKNVIKEYKEKYNDKINNVYAFTDGEDDYNGIDVKYLNVYRFDKAGITKLNV